METITARCRVCGVRPRARDGPQPLCADDRCRRAFALAQESQRAALRELADPALCGECGAPSGRRPARSGQVTYCEPCAADRRARRREDARRAELLERTAQGPRACHNPRCTGVVDALADPRRRYCTDKCARAAEHAHRKARQAGRDPREKPRACRRCRFRKEVTQFPDGVCRACQAEQRRRLKDRRESIRRNVSQRFGDRCAYCPPELATPGEVLDHVRPVAHGGLTEIANLRWACRDCNTDKGDMLLSEWISPRERLTPPQIRGRCRDVRKPPDPLTPGRGPHAPWARRAPCRSGPNPARTPDHDHQIRGGWGRQRAVSPHAPW
ncbi:HNH endonuclease [Kitasatospora sp. NPDC088548]|uniref:HNH endonuclease n=1 Tax=Kitasatospora sp. NPDC088548 TaxID=3364075 RepID=UPI00381EC517